MSTTAVVDRIPKCALCSNPAVYDAKTLAGPWGYLCGQHFRAHTTGELGTGKGQRLVLAGSPAESTTGPMQGKP